MSQKTEVVVIGGGPGGYVAAIRLGQLGKNTVLIIGVDKMEEAIKILEKNWVQMYDGELYTL